MPVRGNNRRLVFEQENCRQADTQAEESSSAIRARCLIFKLALFMSSCSGGINTFSFLKIH
jgi:hypothetical protein